MNDKDEVRLSICVVTYNHEKYIKRALDSFLMQKTNFKFQIFVGDDVSTDNTAEILKEYALKYPDIVKPIFHKENKGPFNNSMSVYSAAKTEYVAICDGDDYWTDENKLQMQVDYLDNNKDCSICYHNTRVTFNDKNSTDIIWPPPEYRFNKMILTLEDLSIRNPMHTSSVVYRWRFKDENIRDYFKEVICPGDLFLALLHAEKGRVGFIDRTMSVYQRHRGGMSADLMGKEDLVWLKYGLEELRFHKYVELHFKYKLAKYFRYEKTKKSVKVLEAYIKNDAFDKLEAFKNEFPEYYELAQENRFNPIYNSSITSCTDNGCSNNFDPFIEKTNKNISKLKKRQRLIFYSILLLILSVAFLFIKGNII